jgi:hypothetical protein
VTAAAAASPAATVTRSSGLLFAQGADGRAKILAEGSAIAAGDTLVSGKAAFARITFADAGNVVLGPDTQLVIDAFTLDAARPASERAEFTLVRGAVQVASGTIAKRGADRQSLKTPLGTISGGDSTFIVTYSPADAATVAMLAPVRLAALSSALSGTLSDAPPVWLAQNTPGSPSPPGAAGRAPGLYVQVLDGIIHLSNAGGSQTFAAGQFGFTPGFKQPPVVLPANPGMQFTPPPSFSSSTASSSSNGSNKPGTVDCEVR